MKIITGILCFIGKVLFAFIPKKRFRPENVKKILFSRECCLGDVLMTTPALASLRAFFPEAEIDYMTGGWSREVVQNNPDINNVFDYSGLRGIKKNAAGTIRAISALREKKYDLIIVGDVGIAPILTAFLAGARYRAGFDAFNRGFSLTHRLPRKTEERLHEREAYLKLLELLGIPAVTREMKYAVSGEAKRQARDWIRVNNPEGALLVAMFPGGGDNPGTTMPSKRWPAVDYAGLAARLSIEKGAKIILLGGQMDVEVNELVADEAGVQLFDLAGETNLDELAGMLEVCDLFICNDSGPMHLAAAVGTPTLALFGPTDPEKLAPSGEKYIYLKTILPCSPCYKQIIGSFTACEEPECMTAITVEQVMEKLEEAGLLRKNHG